VDDGDEGDAPRGRDLLRGETRERRAVGEEDRVGTGLIEHASRLFAVAKRPRGHAPLVEVVVREPAMADAALAPLGRERVRRERLRDGHSAAGVGEREAHAVRPLLGAIDPGAVGPDEHPLHRRA
jgi:hypothetical protein